jgi:hypothetical protein
MSEPEQSVPQKPESELSDTDQPDTEKSDAEQSELQAHEPQPHKPRHYEERGRLSSWMWWVALLVALTTTTWILRGTYSSLSIFPCRLPHNFNSPYCLSPTTSCIICSASGKCASYHYSYCKILRFLKVRTIGDDLKPYFLDITTTGLEGEVLELSRGDWYNLMEVNDETICIVYGGRAVQPELWVCFEIHSTPPAEYRSDGGGWK